MKTLPNNHFSEKEALEVFLKILKGLKFIHEHTIIHRDLKCENILMKDNEPKIADFGLAKKLQEN